MAKVSGVHDSGLPAGTIVPCGNSAALPRTLMCDGSAVSRTTYPALFAAIGTSFGSGDGSTTFNIPDLRGTFLRGVTNITSKTLGAINTVNETITITNHGYNRSGIPVRFTGAVPGGLNTTATWFTIYVDANTLAFASTQALAMAGTKVGLTSTTTGGTINQYIDPDALSRLNMASGGNSGNAVGSVQSHEFANHYHDAQSTSNSGTSPFLPTGSAFGGPAVTFARTGQEGGNETRPINAYVNYCIAY